MSETRSAEDWPEHGALWNTTYQPNSGRSGCTRQTYWVRLEPVEGSTANAEAVCNLCSRMSLSTMLNTANRPKRTNAVKSPRLTADRMSDKMHSMAVSAD